MGRLIAPIAVCTGTMFKARCNICCTICGYRYCIFRVKDDSVRDIVAVFYEDLFFIFYLKDNGGCDSAFCNIKIPRFFCNFLYKFQVALLFF